MKYYRIKDWEKYFERSGNRNAKTFHWVAMPVKHDGAGYVEFITPPEDAGPEYGAEMLGAWVGIVQVAAKCDPRGSLIKSSGQPHDARSISAVTRLSVESIQKALNKCVSDSVGWIEVVDNGQVITNHSAATVSPQANHSAAVPQYSTVQDSTEQNRTTPVFPPTPQPTAYKPKFTREDAIAIAKLYPEQSEPGDVEYQVTRCLPELASASTTMPKGANEVEWLSARVRAYAESWQGKFKPKQARYWFASCNRGYDAPPEAWAEKPKGDEKPKKKPTSSIPGFEPKNAISPEVLASLRESTGGVK